MSLADCIKTIKPATKMSGWVTDFIYIVEGHTSFYFFSYHVCNLAPLLLNYMCKGKIYFGKHQIFLWYFAKFNVFLH